MGQLRSALSTAIRAVGGPARALDVLGRYARCIDGALATTVVQVVIDCAAHTIDYSRAGHLPPVLLSPGGAAPRPGRRTPARRPGRQLRAPPGRCRVRGGATLTLYTDGLIERRGEDIDTGLDRLVGSLTRHHRLVPEPLADAVLTDLGVMGGATDDIALVVIRL